MNKECSILILSCDKNYELLSMFFRYFEKNWSDCQYDIYISLEKHKQVNTNLNIHVINYIKNDNWSERIKYALKHIPSENVIILLDDFIIEDKVNTNEIEKANQYILEHKNIANIIFTETYPDKIPGRLVLSKYIERSTYGKYKTSLQCAIWKKGILMELLRNNENAWEFEIFSNIRSFKLNMLFYALSDNKKKPIPYNNGFFIVQGKINTREKNRLEKKFNEKINLTGYSETGENLIRDDINLLNRIIRRLKIMIYFVLYRIL